jgi:hypothetical protein
VEQKITLINKEISKLQGIEGLPNKELLKQLQTKVNSLLTQEDLNWQQRLKELRLKCGDRNTKFFHACVTQRRRKNFIHKIKDGRGRIWENGEGVENAFAEYYVNLL